jgi:CubicO group peptidase (beta-lactamase class C family)
MSATSRRNVLISAMSRLVTFSAFIYLCAQLPAQSISVPKTVPPDVQQHIDRMTTCLHPEVQVKDDPHSCTTLSARMAQLHIPGVSVAVIHNGVIEWAAGFGVKQLGGAPVGADTLFQAGSISKPVAAIGALHQVQEKKLSLDADVNTELVSWKIPDSPAANNKPVTLRELLTHTAGSTVHGFPGYAATDPVPTLLQVLDGQKPANTAPIRLESEPGSKWNYSGGGYTVMQQVLLDVTKESFPKLMQDTALGPIGMTHSTYQQPLPAALQPEAATPYDWKSEPISGGAHTYPEMAAAGLWTTPSDLARYCIETQLSLRGKSNRVLSQNLTQQMVTPGLGNWGLGLEIGGSATDPYFSHGGVNAGFESLFVAYEHRGDGAVIMTNAMGGTALAYEIMESIATEYGWPDFRPVIHTPIKLDPAVLTRFVGNYELLPHFTINVTLAGDQLMVEGLQVVPGAKEQPKFPLFPESRTGFFLKVMKTQLEFVTDDRGQVSHVILHQGGQDLKGEKK